MANKLVEKSLPDLNNARARNLTFNFDYEKIEIPEAVKEYAKGRKYFIHTYGCQANYRDEEEMAGLLELAGYKKANAIEEAEAK